jgi:lysyl endopeptidase
MMKKLLLSTYFVFCILFNFAQLIPMGLPKSLENNLPTAHQLHTHLMESFDLQQMVYEDSINDYHKIGPWRFGKNFDVNFNLQNSGVWHNLPNGDRIWRIRLVSPGALTINVIFDEYVIPQGAFIYMYNIDTSHIVGAYTALLNNPDKIIGSEIVEGNDIVIEYYEPSYAIGQGNLKIGTVTHGYRSLSTRAESLLKGLNDSGACNIDVLCPLGVGWEQQIQSVAMIVVNGNGSCTGALINNTNNDGKPYFLTANHCLGNPANWVFRFNWHSPNPSCATNTNSTNGTFNQTIFNSVLRANRANSDFALVELNNNIPDSWNPYYAGWDRTGTTPNFTVGIHHPRGDIKKICKDNDPPNPLNTNNQPVWRVLDWDEGVTEPGSSGSPLFNQDKKIVGQLWRGTAACSGTNDNGGYDEYGRFDASWDGTAANTRLRDWLDPNNTGTTILDGYDPNAILTQNDAGIISIPNPSGTICGGTITPEITLRNFGSNVLTSVVIQYQLNGVAPQNFNWSGNLASGQTTVVELPVILLNAGSTSFTATTSQPNGVTDENTANDGKTENFTLNSSIAPTISGNNTVCSGTSTTFTANTTDHQVFWYNNLTSATPLQVGNTLTINQPEGTYTYYAESINDTSTRKVGPNTFLNGGFLNTVDRYLVFDVFEELVLKSVLVNAQTAGNRTFQLRNSLGQVIQQVIVNLPAGVSRANLNFTIQPGTNYQLKLGGTTSSLWRADDLAGVQYPYTIQNLISIKESDIGISTPANANRYYYYFYDWEVQAVPCKSLMAEVSLTVNNCTNNAPVADFYADKINICAGESITFTSTSSQNPTSLLWDFPGATPNNSINSNPTVTYSTSGIYNVTLTATNAFGSDSETKTSYITVNELPQVIVSATLNTSCLIAENGSIEIEVNGGAGNYTYLWSNGAETQDLSNVASGNYSLTVTDDNGCSNYSTQSIGVDNSLIVNLNVTDNSNTQGNSSILAVVGGGSEPYTFSWNNGDYSGNFIENLIAIDYFVIVTDSEGCEAYSDTITIGAPLSVQNTSSIYEAIIYPNPAGSEVNIAMELDRTQQLAITVYNASGQIYHKEFLNNFKNGIFKMNVENFASGVYFVKIQAESEVKVIPFTKTNK